MLLDHIDKPHYNNLDISIFLEYAPDIVLEFFQHDHINISLIVYQELKDLFADPSNLNENVPKWILFIDKILDMENDLYNLEENDNLQRIGPAYYTKTNTRFYFFKSPFEHEGLTAGDLNQLVELNSTPSIDDDLAKYYATLKCKPIMRKTREELIYDINMCIMAIEASAFIKEQICFQNKIIEEREKFLNAPYQALVEPEKPENKPEKPNKKDFRFRAPWSRQGRPSMSYAEACERYSRELRVYYINYREYEKACDRYKDALREWEIEKNHLINRSIEDIKKAKLKIKKGNRILKIYHEIIKALEIHPSYLTLEALKRFRYFLETGRASTLQECMNLYEQELYWEELKESQARIERNILATVYFLQSEAAAATDENIRTPDGLIEFIIKRLKEGGPEHSKTE